MIIKLIDTIWPIVRAPKNGDRVTDSLRYGTVVAISDYDYTTVQWDNDNEVVHLTKELKIIRKGKI